MIWVIESFGLKEDNLSHKNCQNQLSHPKGRLRVHKSAIFEVIFVTLIEKQMTCLVCCNKWLPGTSEISISPEHGTKTIPVFSPGDWEASSLLLPHLVSLPSDGRVQPEKTYSCILKVTGQVRESQEWISINTNHSYHQHSPP